MKLLILLGLFSWCITSFNIASAQDKFIAHENSPELKETILKKIEARIEKDVVRQEESSFYRERARIYKLKKKNLLKRVEEDQFIIGSVFNTYVDSIARTIFQSNASLDSTSLFLISRSSSANASYVGSGIYIINLGLLSKLRSDAELAFVISHEMAHHNLDHVALGIEAKLEAKHDRAAKKELKSKIKKVKGEDFLQNQKFLEIVKEKVYDRNRYSRLEETQADSLAMRYLQNTTYNLNRAVGVLNVLDSADYDLFRTVPAYEEILAIEGEQFPEDWFEKNQSIFETKDSEAESVFIPDSLKTHPDVDERISYLLKEAYLDSTYQFEGSAEIPAIATAELELIKSEYDSREYASSLYRAVHAYTGGAKNAFVAAYIGKNLNMVAELKTMHALSNFYAWPDPSFYSEGFNELLGIVQNMDRLELAKRNLKFLQSQPKVFKRDDNFKEAYEQAAKHVSNLRNEDAAYNIIYNN
jgi:hypothetical protein